MDQQTTSQVIAGKILVDDLHSSSPGLHPGKWGAPGGSMLISREQFIDVGGLDPDLFNGYAPEDVFFWMKISDRIGNITSAQAIEMFHMHHDGSHRTSEPRFQAIVASYAALNEQERAEFIKARSRHLNEQLQSM